MKKSEKNSYISDTDYPNLQEDGQVLNWRNDSEESAKDEFDNLIVNNLQQCIEDEEFACQHHEYLLYLGDERYCNMLEEKYDVKDRQAVRQKIDRLLNALEIVELMENASFYRDFDDLYTLCPENSVDKKQLDSSSTIKLLNKYYSSEDIQPENNDLFVKNEGKKKNRSVVEQELFENQQAKEQRYKKLLKDPKFVQSMENYFFGRDFDNLYYTLYPENNVDTKQKQYKKQKQFDGSSTIVALLDSSSSDIENIKQKTQQKKTAKKQNVIVKASNNKKRDLNRVKKKDMEVFLKMQAMELKKQEQKVKKKKTAKQQNVFVKAGNNKKQNLNKNRKTFPRVVLEASKAWTANELKKIQNRAGNKQNVFDTFGIGKKQYNNTKEILNRVENNHKYDEFCRHNFP